MKTKALTILLLLLPVLTACARTPDIGIRVSEIEGHFTGVAAGHGTTFAIHCDGSLWWWGRFVSADAGFSTTCRDADGAFYGARLVDIDGHVVYVASAGHGGNSSARGHAMAITSCGVLWGWGYNRNGQVGNGTRQLQGVPVRIMDDVVSVVTVDSATLAITSDGRLWGWGLNRNGRLGGIGELSEHPVVIMEDIAQVSGGLWHTLAIGTDGTLWGIGIVSALGVGIGQPIGTPTADMPAITTPVKIMEDVVAIAAGGSHSLALTSCGALWVWGNNVGGQLGNGRRASRNDTYINYPYPVMRKENVVAIAAGHMHSAAITSDGGLYVWGLNESTNQFTPDTQFVLQPQRIMEDVASIHISTSNMALHTHMIAVKNDNSLWSWGNNTYGQLGDSAILHSNRWEPALIHTPGLSG